MNWQTLDKILSENIIPWENGDGLHEAFFKKMAAAAKFVVGVPEKVQSASECYKGAMVDGEIALPFKTVKILDTIPDLRGGTHGYVVGVRNGTLVAFEAMHGGVAPDGALMVATMTASQIETGASNDMVEVGGGVMVKGRVLHTVSSSMEISRSCVGLINRMCWFISLVNTPGHYVAKVSPSKNQQKTHSVQWTEAKSHYIVLSRQHGKEIKDGKSRDFNGTITRAMHDRRAHQRFLQSPRYKDSRFKRIWIRQTWVGPKEWEGQNGSIYKIINPEGKRFYEANRAF